MREIPIMIVTLPTSIQTPYYVKNIFFKQLTSTHLDLNNDEFVYSTLSI